MSDPSTTAAERIRALAFELWDEAGQPEGHSERFWFKAERQIKAEEEGYDDALADTFPASDPPANSGIT